jgi:putative esterase
LLRVEIVRAFSAGRNPRLLWFLGLISILVSNFFLAACSTSSKEAITRPTTSDDFNRADGSLGQNWNGLSDGRLKISSHVAAGTNVSGASGDIWASRTFTGDQYSQIKVTSAQLTGNQWIGPAVRVQDDGQNAYLGIYWWNSGKPELKLYLRRAENWTQIGDVYDSGPLPAGTRLELIAVGNTISFLQNGIRRISVANNTLSRGAPGIIAYGTAKADSWSGGDASSFEVNYSGTDARGIKSYDMVSDNNGYGPQILRVLPPADPAPGVAHNFLIVLRVNPGRGTRYGDGLQTLQALDAQNRYNLTIIEPTFAFDPWYSDNPFDSHFRYETFMAHDLVPWIKRNLAITGHEQIWLIGFSKSGLGAQDLILKHPDLFTLAASWDFPADMSSSNQYGDSASAYGNNANFQANYRLTAAFVNAHKASFLRKNRIWIGGYALCRKDISDYSELLASIGIAHTTGKPLRMAHRWNSGWVPIALNALYQDSIHLR